MVALNVSLYLLYHILLLTLMAAMFNVKTISKIFTNEKFPDAGFYIVNGLIGLVVMWPIFKLLECLTKNDDKIKRLIYKNEEKSKSEYAFKLKDLVCTL